MSEAITLTMSREQAQAVMDATELLARLEIGQFEEITWKMIERFRGRTGMASRRLMTGAGTWRTLI